MPKVHLQTETDIFVILNKENDQTLITSVRILSLSVCLQIFFKCRRHWKTVSSFVRGLKPRACLRVDLDSMPSRLSSYYL